MRSCILLIVLCTIAGIVNAQLPDYHVRVYNEKSGLRAEGLLEIVRDQKDFLWLLYPNRVQRFDGKYTREYRLENNLTDIFCDEKNRIWVSSFKHLYLYTNDKSGFAIIPFDTVDQTPMGKFFQPSGHELWLNTSNGFYRFDPSRQQFYRYTHPALTGFSHFYSQCFDNYQSNLFFFTPDSFLNAFDINNGKIKRLPATNVFNINAMSEQLAVVTTWEGKSYWFNFADQTITPVRVSEEGDKHPEEFFSVNDVIRIDNNRYFFARLNGLYEYTNTATGGVFKKLHLFFEGRPLPPEYIFNDLYLDNKGEVWASSNSGIVAFPVVQSQIGLIRNNATDNTPGWDHNIRNFVPDKKGNLWMAAGTGFAHWDLKKNKVQPFFAKEGALDRLNHRSVRGIAYDGHYVILGPTDKGVWLYDPAEKKYRRPSYLPGATGESTRKKIEDDFIDQIYTLRDGRHVIAGRDAAYIMDGKTYVITEPDFPGKNENINFTYQDSNKNIWIGTSKGLYGFDSTLLFRFSVKDIAGDTLFCMTELQPGELLVGSTHLYHISYTSEGAHARKEHPFFDKMLIALLYKDNAGNVWVGSDEGLFRYQVQQSKIESFDYWDNVQGNFINPSSFYRKPGGNLYIGGIRGINYFVPENIPEKKDILQVSIMKMTVNNDDTSFLRNKKDLSLHYFQNTIELEFMAPYYGNASTVQYRYRLRGIDTTWINNGTSNTVRFAALPPGNYAFSVAASINNIDWYESSEPVSFFIHPPFWKTWWFMMLMAFTIIALLYILYWYEFKKRLEMERMRLKISRDLHDDVGSVLSSINISSEVALRQGVQDHQLHQFLSRIKESSALSMESMSDIVWAINPVNDSLDKILARMREFAGDICEPKNIDYHFSISPDLNHVRMDLNKRKDLYLIYKEAINNAVKYSVCTRIEIKLERRRQTLILRVADNGKGFDQHSVKVGNGLKNMQERANEINASITIQSAPGVGTIVELVIPVT